MVLVPATEMFPAAVQVSTPEKKAVNEHAPTAVALQPTGSVIVTIAVVPEIVNIGPDGMMAVAEATVAVNVGVAVETPLYPLNPGTHVLVIVEQIH